MPISVKGELVSFETQDGLTLHGFLMRPKRGSDKALIHIHGMEGTFYRSNFAKVLAKKCINNGLNFLSIELRGSYTAMGLRKRKGKKSSWYSGGGGFEVFEECIYDIGNAIKFLGRLGIRKVYLEGHSTGCQKAVYYQYKTKDKRVKAIILTAPADDYNVQKNGLGKRFGSAVSAAKILAKKGSSAVMPERYIKRPFGARRFLSFSDPKNVESRIFNYELRKLREFGSIRKPILAMFGSKDEYMLKPAKRYLKILEDNSGSKGFSSRVISGADHGFDGREAYAANVIIRWLSRLR